MSYTVPPNFVPFSFDVYDNDSVATHSPYPQPFNLEDNQLLNSIDPFVTCLYQATASAQTLPEISMCACDACYMPIGQHFDSSELKLGNLNYGISITEMNESSRLAKGSPYEVPFSSQPQINYSHAVAASPSQTGPSLYLNEYLPSAQYPKSPESCVSSSPYESSFKSFTTEESEEAPQSSQSASPSSANFLECSMCQSTFRDRKFFNQHVRLHSKPHKCLKCEKAFKHTRDFRRHLRTHDVVSAPGLQVRIGEFFFCEHVVCRYHVKGFTRKDNYQRHMRNQHRHVEESETT